MPGRGRGRPAGTQPGSEADVARRHHSTHLGVRNAQCRPTLHPPEGRRRWRPPTHGGEGRVTRWGSPSSLDLRETPEQHACGRLSGPHSSLFINSLCLRTQDLVSVAGFHG